MTVFLTNAIYCCGGHPDTDTLATHHNWWYDMTNFIYNKFTCHNYRCRDNVVKFLYEIGATLSSVVVCICIGVTSTTVYSLALNSVGTESVRECQENVLQTNLYWIFTGIGHKYAILEMKAMITRMLRHFELFLAEESKPFPLLKYEIVLSSQEKIYFHLQPRVY